ncbi:MAG: cobyrinate a,c-diamide synthase [Eubacteriaceae bacterium]|nr:cobyrinate a,c-diamide synthase [Eubacteriaceae bacterium]
MYRMMLAAPRSGTGKTSVTIALLGALKRKGIDVCSFKCGPDYIDPMYHRSVLGVECRNCDLFFLSEDALRDEYHKYAAGRQAAVFEGVMGFYDGIGTTDAAGSAWHVADTLDIPVILVMDPKGTSLTIAALIKGLATFKEPSHVAGVIFNKCSKAMYEYLKDMVEETTGLPVFGYLPVTPEAALESRHLGLYTSGEIEELSEKLSILTDRFLECVDMDRLLSAMETEDIPPLEEKPPSKESVKIAVAHDDAFCFTYDETLALLRENGAELVYFSPMKDERIPEDCSGLYLPGGYPELYAGQLSENKSMLEDMKQKISSGLPTVAECGGFLYLGKSLTDPDGTSYPMVGLLGGEAANAGKLVRFGYCTITAGEDSLLLKKGESVPVHEFHYWDSTDNGEAFSAAKPSGRSWKCGFATDTLYAGFPHLYMLSHPVMAERFTDKAREYGRKK